MGKLIFYASVLTLALACIYLSDRRAENVHMQWVHAQAVAAQAQKMEAAKRKADLFSQAYSDWKATEYPRIFRADPLLAQAMDRMWNEQGCRAMESIGKHVGQPNMGKPDKLEYLQCQELEKKLRAEGLWYDAK